MTDRELIHKVAEEGDEKAFAEIVSRYGGMVFSKALGIVKNEELASEVSQQTFVKAYEKLAYCHNETLGPWLMAIAFHTAVDILNKEKRRRGVPIDQAILVEESDYSEQREQRLQQLDQAIAQLSPDDQQIIRMHYYEHCSTKEVAKRTEMTQSNVLVRLHRVRDRLKKILSNDTDN